MEKYRGVMMGILKSVYIHFTRNYQEKEDVRGKARETSPFESNYLIRISDIVWSSTLLSPALDVFVSLLGWVTRNKNRRGKETNSIFDFSPLSSDQETKTKMFFWCQEGTRGSSAAQVEVRCANLQILAEGGSHF